MPNKVPSLDRMDRQRGSLVIAGKPHVLVDWPVPVHGPAFEPYGSDCVEAYVIEVMDQENVPVGPIDLAVWPTLRSFTKGEGPAATFHMPDLAPKDE